MRLANKMALGSGAGSDASGLQRIQARTDTRRYEMSAAPIVPMDQVVAPRRGSDLVLVTAQCRRLMCWPAR